LRSNPADRLRQEDVTEGSEIMGELILLTEKHKAIVSSPHIRFTRHHLHTMTGGSDTANTVQDAERVERELREEVALIKSQKAEIEEVPTVSSLHVPC